MEQRRSCSTCRHLVSMGHGRMGDRPTWIRHCDVCVNAEALKEPDPVMASEVCKHYEMKTEVAMAYAMAKAVEQPKPAQEAPKDEHPPEQGRAHQKVGRPVRQPKARTNPEGDAD